MTNESEEKFKARLFAAVGSALSRMTFDEKRAAATATDMRMLLMLAEKMPVFSPSELNARALKIFGTQRKALSWMLTRHPALNDQTPLAVSMTQSGLERLVHELERHQGTERA